MSSEVFLILLGGLLVLAFHAEGLFRRFRIPPVLVLIACGVILGPLARLLPGERLIGVAPHFGALAFLLILLEGGLTWRWYAAGLALVGLQVIARRLLLDFIAVRTGLELDDQERNTVILLQSRGLVSAVLVIEVVELVLERGHELLGLASPVIVVTNLLLAVAARRGGLPSGSPGDRP